MASSGSDAQGSARSTTTRCSDQIAAASRTAAAATAGGIVDWDPNVSATWTGGRPAPVRAAARRSDGIGMVHRREPSVMSQILCHHHNDEVSSSRKLSTWWSLFTMEDTGGTEGWFAFFPFLRVDRSRD